MHYSSLPSPHSFVSSKVSWTAPIDQSSRTQPPSSRNPGTPWMSTVTLPDGGSPFFSDPSTPTSSLRRELGGPSLHPLLGYDPVGRIYYDLRQPTTQIRLRSPQFVNLRQPASDPVVGRMLACIPGTPWMLNIQNPQGVTIEIVLTTLYNELQYVVSKAEYATFPVHVQHHAARLFHGRAGGNHAELSQGIKRVDFLCTKTLFLGLTRATDGSDSWVVKLGENPNP